MTDFGIAESLNPTLSVASPSASSSAPVLGSPYWMAPEVRRGREGGAKEGGERERVERGKEREREREGKREREREDFTE